MQASDIAAALQRAEDACRRRPSQAMEDDATAAARWSGGLQVESGHANGQRVVTDMPTTIGGGGAQPSPGWLFRAGLASCLATSIAMVAARDGIELTELEVRADSRSDARGVFGVPDADGRDVDPAPAALRLHVRIAARDAGADALRRLVETARRRSPIPALVERAAALALTIDAG